MVSPAYSIPLSDKDLALLGELVAILGQIEEDMTLTVSGLIQGDRPTTEKVMGSSKAADKAAPRSPRSQIGTVNSASYLCPHLRLMTLPRAA